MDVFDIVKAWLEDSEYDGLYVPGECACKKDDLAPCGEMRDCCEAGFLTEAPAGSDFEFFIGPERTRRITPR